MALTGCCGCFDLKRGSIAIGITLLVLNALGAVIDTGYLIYLAVNGVDLSQPAPLTGISFGYTIVAAAIGFNCALIMGVKRASRPLILAWIIFYGIIFALMSLAVLIQVVYVCLVIAKVVAEVEIGQFILWTLLFAGLNAVQWYWFAVVVAHMNQLDDASLAFGYRQQEGAVVLNTKDMI